jgi:hypothetical protein
MAEPESGAEQRDDPAVLILKAGVNKCHEIARDTRYTANIRSIAVMIGDVLQAMASEAKRQAASTAFQK